VRYSSTSNKGLLFWGFAGLPDHHIMTDYEPLKGKLRMKRGQKRWGGRHSRQGEGSKAEVVWTRNIKR
jgi:hypothetical protein